MANELNNAMKTVAEKLVQYVKDVAVLSVETRYVTMQDQSVTFDAAVPVARTEIRLDGDSSVVLPVRPKQSPAGEAVVGQTGMEIDSDLFEVHQRNVNTAIEYRARMIASLMQLFRQASPPQG